MIIIIADDLTGANDTGVQFQKNGFSTMVQTEYSDVQSEYLQCCNCYDALSINVNSRQLPPEEAYRRVYNLARQISEIPTEYVYKKIDSLLRGNPAAELDAVMDALGAETALVVPSFPENGRQLVNGIMVTQDDRINVEKIFREGSKRSTFKLSLEEIGKGPESLKQLMKRKQKEGFQIFIADATSDLELETIKNAAKPIDRKMIFCGSAGFAKQLSNEKRFQKELVTSEKSENAVLVVAGSRRKETAVQLQQISEAFLTPIVKIDVSKVENGGRSYSEEITRCTDQILQTVQEGHKLILLAVSSLFSETQEKPKPENKDPEAVNIAAALGETVEKIYRRIRLRAVVSTGGDTSLQICRAFRSKGIELCDEITAGIPVGRMVGGEADGMVIITKSGGFGNGDALIQVVNYLDDNRNENERRLYGG